MKKLLTFILATALLCTCLFATACNKEQAKLKIIDISLTSEEYAFVMAKDNTTLKTQFDAFLAEIESDGTFDTLLDKYFKGNGTKVGYDISDGDTANTDANLVVVTNTPFEPFEYTDKGKIYGLDIEIAGLFAQKHGLTLVIKNIDFDAIFSQVENGYADIGMAGITISPDRLELYSFSTAYYNASQKLIVAADNTDFDACETVADVEAILSSLSGKKIGYQNGTTGGMYVDGNEDWGYDGFDNIEGVGYKTAQLAAQDIVNGNIYAVVVDDAPASAIVEAMNH